MSPRSSSALVYSCSGSSNVAQLANYVAVRLDRLGLAEMSCIAGVGGDVKPLVRTATSGRPVVAIDGCPLACCEKVLRAKGVEPENVVRLDELGLRKRQHIDFEQPERDTVLETILQEAAPTLVAAEPGVAKAIEAELSRLRSTSRGRVSPPSRR